MATILHDIRLDYFERSPYPCPAMVNQRGTPYFGFKGSRAIPDTNHRYWITHTGQVADLDENRLIALHVVSGGDRLHPTRVAALKTYRQRKMRWTTRSVRQLVAEAFLPDPYPELSYEPSVIQLDGDWQNCHVDNLAWRPRWFARHFARQSAALPKPEWLDVPVIDLEHGYEYVCIYDAAQHQGLLVADIFISLEEPIGRKRPLRFTGSKFSYL